MEHRYAVWSKRELRENPRMMTRKIEQWAFVVDEMSRELHLKSLKRYHSHVVALGDSGSFFVVEEYCGNLWWFLSPRGPSYATMVSLISHWDVF